jgi:zinc protease
VLIVAGKFDEAKALSRSEALRRDPEARAPLAATYTEEPPQDGERTVTLRRVGDVGAVGVAYHTPSAGHPTGPP